MDLFSLPPVAAVLAAAAHLLSAVVAGLTPLAGPAAPACAVVALTVAVRVILIPVGLSQVRAEAARARLAPAVRRLKERFGSDPARLQRELSALYAREKASPAAGCLPLLAQAPVLSLLYALFLHPQIDGHANALLTHGLAGVPLGTRLVAAAGDPHAILVLVLLLAILTGVVAWSRWALARTAPVVPGAEPTTTGGAQTTVLTRALSYAPFVTVVFAAFVPLAAVVYLITTSAWTAGERVTLRRLIGRR